MKCHICGGTKASGYVQRLLAEGNLDASKVSNPSKYIQLLKPKPKPKIIRKLIKRPSYDKTFYEGVDKVYNITKSRTLDVKVSKEFLNSLLGFQNNYDLFPTPIHCLNKIRNDLLGHMDYDYGKNWKKETYSFLEPSAGTGSIVRSIIDLPMKISIDANEFTGELANFLKEKIKGINVYNEDFLKFLPKNYYDFIIMNPPFTQGKDKTYYLKHLLKAMLLALNNYNNNDEHTTIYIICPNSILDKSFERNKEAEEYGTDLDLSIFKNIKVPRLTWNDKNQAFNELESAEIRKIGNCDGFSKLNAKGIAKPQGGNFAIYCIYNIK